MAKEDFDLMFFFDVVAIEVGHPAHDFRDKRFDSILWQADADLIFWGCAWIRAEPRENRFRWYRMNGDQLANELPAAINPMFTVTLVTSLCGVHRSMNPVRYAEGPEICRVST